MTSLLPDREFGRQRLQPMLAAIHENQYGGTKPHDLSREFRSYRTARPGDQHPFAFDEMANRSGVETNRCPLEQIYDGELANLTDGDLAV